MNDTPMTEPDRDANLLDFLPIDPFAAQREAASKIVGLGGDQPALEPGYVFQSLHIYPVPGPVRFTLHFHGLTASMGTLTVRLHAFSRYPGTAPMLQKTIAFPLKDVAAKDGIVIVELNSRRNMGYLIGGTIDDDTDARADALSLSLDPRERDTALVDRGASVPVVEAPAIVPVEGWREKPELATIRPVRFARPVSQAMTVGQCDDPLARAWNTVLHQEDCDARRRWQDAFILQTLHHYGIAAKGGSCLGMGRENSRLPAYFANGGYAVLFAVLSHDTLPDADPGLALERLERPDLCASLRFYEQIDLTLFDDLIVPPALTGFDFLWSIDAPAHPDARNRFPVMLRDAMHCLQPGGLAIHVLRYSGQLDAPADPGSTSYGRAEIERMALSLVADGHDVAQLNFAIDRPTRPGEDLRLPFALVVRRTN